MNSLRAFGHLVWKDSRSITPLAVAMLVGAVLAVLTSTLIGSHLSNFDPRPMIIFFGALIPGIFIYAAGPVLVGSEEESGTLSWLAGLPVSWFAVTLSKMLVALIWYFVIAVACYALVMMALHSLGRFDSIYEVSTASVLYWMFYGCFLWLLSFLCAYTVRSPIWGLLLIVPAWILLNWLIGDRLFSLSVRGFQFEIKSPVLLIATFAILASLTFSLSRIRMTRPWFMTSIASVVPQTLEAYQPPKTMDVHRPSEWGALLWQQWRQFWLIGFAVLVISALPSLVYAMGNYHRERSTWSILAAVFGSSILGSLTFYNDSLKSRCLFFGERGLSQFKFWFSRLIVSVAFSIACLGIAIGSVYGEFVREHDVWSVAVPVLCICLIVWSLGVLSPIIVKRPILAFFIPIVLFAMSAMAFGYLYAEFYKSYVWTIAAACPVILLASWFLCEDWLTRRLDLAFYSKAVGFIVVALSAPLICVFATRYFTTPAISSQWEAAMLKSESAAANLPETSIFALDVSKLELPTIEKLELELEGKDPIGQHVHLRELDMLPLSSEEFSEQEIENARILALKVRLSWSRRVREAAVNGETDPRSFSLYAENNDAIVAATLTSKPPEDLKELVEWFPSKELRKSSRLAVVKQMWLAFHRTQSIPDQSKQFAGMPLASTITWLPVENWRQNRIVDKAAELMTEEIESGRNFEKPQAQAYLHELLREAYLGLSHSQYQERADKYWSESQLGWVFGFYITERTIKVLETK